MFPKQWEEFIENNKIIGVEFEIDEELDLSEMGVYLKIMTSEESNIEATEVYPGILAAKEYYVPIAICLEGSGDYYYINSKDGQSNSLYRIYHDLLEESKINEDDIDKVLENYEEILRYRVDHNNDS